VELLHQRGHALTVFNRGVTTGSLPEGVKRLYGDRSSKQDLQAAVGSATFDAVIDTTLYTGADALTAIDVLKDRIGHYIFIGTGQVYLVRKGVTRPFREEDYEGGLMTPPLPEHESDHSNWLYGINKRDAEDHCFAAWGNHGFPVTSLRAPMINGERDHYGRILGYIRRLEDGGPILVPEGPALPLRHVYCEDVAGAVVRLIESGSGKGRAYNLSQDETISISDFLSMLAAMLSTRLQLHPVPRATLEKLHLLPSCSPFGGIWMSELDNTRSKQELGISYTPLPDYLRRIVSHYSTNRHLQPEGYETRDRELRLATGER
jgi:nucleoside-diphosphate-sugar epimerase